MKKKSSWSRRNSGRCQTFPLWATCVLRVFQQGNVALDTSVSNLIWKRETGRLQFTLVPALFGETHLFSTCWKSIKCLKWTGLHLVTFSETTSAHVHALSSHGIKTNQFPVFVLRFSSNAIFLYCKMNSCCFEQSASAGQSRWYQHCAYKLT